MIKFKSEHITTQPSKDKISKREHFFPPSVTAKAVPPPPFGGGCLIGKYFLKTKRDKDNTFFLCKSGISLWKNS